MLHGAVNQARPGVNGEQSITPRPSWGKLSRTWANNTRKYTEKEGLPVLVTDGVWSDAGVVCQFEAVAKKGSTIGSEAPGEEND